MSTNKAALKAAKAALDAQKWDEAITQALVVLASDSQNYFANLFLGLAHHKKGQPSESAKAYEKAAKIRPNDTQAYQGLLALYEDQGSKNVDEYITTASRLASLFAAADDAHRTQTIVDKAVDFARAHGTRAQYKKALELQLPSHRELYAVLEGRVPHPSHTYIRLAELTEAEEKEKINKEIGERRTRLGARLGEVTKEVKREVYGSSGVEELWREVVNWTQDDEVRRQYEEKLLQRAYDKLVVLPLEKKKERREEVLGMAHGMVVIKHPSELAWLLELEWRDVETLGEFDAGVVREFVGFFPELGLSKVLKGFLTSDIAPFPLKVEVKEANGEVDGGRDAPLSAEDRLLLMAEGLDDAKDSALAHRLMAEYYLHLEEYETAVETARKGLKVTVAESQKSGLKFQNNLDAVNNTLATALIQYQSPRNHPEARSLFDAILARKPTFTSALIGVGLILEEEEEYAQAVDFLSRALARDPSNARIGAEAAWCKALNGDYSRGLEELETHLSKMDPKDPRMRDLRAQTQYRIGVCMWELESFRASRKDRGGAYARFLAAIKTNPNFAPAYTSLGIYYADYARDKKRARQCFQKAFELSPSELVAAERLARFFADQGDWDIVELIAQRVVDSGKVRPAPGSKKRGVSWPYSALGVVQMNKQEYQKSIVSFLHALRISPGDYHSYVGLGESYHNSGRYNSAARTFKYAENPSEGVKMKKAEESAWFTKYMLANVNRELGEFDEAIDGYREVLESKPEEFGVSIALLQTLVERAWRCVETGFFGRAADSALEALKAASNIARYRPDAFNLWKAVGDACSVFSSVQIRVSDLPREDIKELLGTSIDIKEYDLFAEVDNIGQGGLSLLTAEMTNPAFDDLTRSIVAAILAQKRAIYACAHDIHAQAVAWYNLGWTEYRAYTCLEQLQEQYSQSKKTTRYLKAAMRCFKRAIELEAGNAEFWNALGVVTTQLNPKVAQHSFVRSLHLNERNVRVWTNLGTLYLLQNDLELAHQAFARAQSTDPDYAHAWLGEGLLALLWGETKEALAHFTHAFEISDSASLISKRQYATSTFDHLLSSSSTTTNNLTPLIQPLFALQQLHSQRPHDLPHHHLSALYYERIGAHDAAIEALTAICAAAEQDYESTESSAALARFAHAKTDLARNRLAAHDFEAAVQDAEMALDLLSDPESSGMSPDVFRKTTLSARLTGGLAHYFRPKPDMDAAIGAFKSALEGAGASPDVVCLLAQVLWAKGGETERGVAKEQLFEVIEKKPGHVSVTVSLGVMAALEEDGDVLEAVREDLKGLRMSGGLAEREKSRVERVLGGIAALEAAEAETEDAELQQRNEILTSILLAPSEPQGWTQLADTTEEAYPALMALSAARRAVPPLGPLSAEELARAFAGTGRVGDAQRAVALAPWRVEGWQALSEGVMGR
ncbi:Superkiller protein 3 [Coniosporium apollinis]|uniref:Superkiller protein 3 n=1 Tax=Coniosporium apollinis TaxID=61459 RepID=A0ABQ9NM72_9PEZI|nr:Superkiller protein 3 [Coniosporium apollinis]